MDADSKSEVTAFRITVGSAVKIAAPIIGALIVTAATLTSYIESRLVRQEERVSQLSENMKVHGDVPAHSEAETRIRALEVRQEGTEGHFSRIEAALDRLEEKLDNLRGRRR